MNLTETQAEVVQSGSRSTAIIAGAGSGKTEVLTQRLIRIVESGEATLHQILAITFTEKAAAELKKRVASKLTDGQKEELPWAALQTFHSFCFDTLKNEAAGLGLSDNIAIWDDPSARLAIFHHCRQTLLEQLEAKGPEAILLVESLEFRESMALLEKLMQERWSFSQWSSQSSPADELDAATRKLFEIIDRNYTLEKEEKGVLDFQDLEILTLRLLQENSGVRARLQKRFRYIFVDEVQDINDLQKELLTALFDPQKNKLCVVGDPKQSIYRFRGSNVTNVERLVDRTCRSGGQKIELRQNFRSVPLILEFVNHLFPEEAPLLPMLENAKGSALNLLEVPLPPKSNVKEMRKAEAESIAGWIDAETATGARRFGDFALLFQSLTEARPYAQALQKRGIPHRLSGGGGFLEAQEVNDLLFVLKLMADIENRMALVGLMRSPLIGFDDIRITEMGLAHPNDLGRALLQTPEAAWLARIWENRDRKNGAAILEETLTATGFDHFLYRFDPGFAANANVEQLIEMVRNLELSETMPLSEITTTFDELKRRQAVLRQSGLQDSHQGTVSLTTVHSAKGLEFPVVILPDLMRGSSHPRPRAFFLKEHGLSFAIKEDDAPFVKAEHDEKGEELWNLEKEAETRERKRLLYVALTRAVEMLVVPDIPDAQRTGPWYKWMREGVKSFGKFERISVGAVGEVPQTEIPRKEPLSFISIQPLRAVSEIGDGPRHATVTGLQQKKSSSFASPKKITGTGGAQVGDLVHAVLKNVRDPKTDNLESLCNKHLFQLEIDIGEKELQEIKTWLAAFLNSDIAPPRWDGKHELPFRFHRDDMQISGVVDYLWEETDGFVLCDFKTDKKPDPKKYRHQLDFYALALSERLPKPLKETRILFLRSLQSFAEPVTPQRLASAEKELHELVRNYKTTAATED